MKKQLLSLVYNKKKLSIKTSRKRQQLYEEIETLFNEQGEEMSNMSKQSYERHIKTVATIDTDDHENWLKATQELINTIQEEKKLPLTRKRGLQILLEKISWRTKLLKTLTTTNNMI